MASGVDSGEKIGKYTKGKQLGRGGTGTVYLAKSDDINEPLALKILASRGSDAFGFLRRGAEAAKRLDHPGIAKTYDYGREGDIYYVVGEYVDGKDLEQIFTTVAASTTVEFELKDLWTEVSGVVDENREGSPDLADATVPTRKVSGPGAKLIRSKSYIEFCCRFMLDAISAIEHAHEQKVFHRDIKPGNLMMTRDGNVKIVDFGAARHEDDASLTRTGMVMGTPMYMSPEQAKGNTTIDAMSDIFSLGATLFEALTLTPPHTARTIPGILHHVANRQIRPVRLENPRVPEGLQRIVHKATALSTDGRYESAKAFAKDLQRFLDGEPAQAGKVKYYSDTREIAAERPHRMLMCSVFHILQAAIILMILPPLMFSPEPAQFLYLPYVKAISFLFFSGLIAAHLIVGARILMARILWMIGSFILSFFTFSCFVFTLMGSFSINMFNTSSIILQIYLISVSLFLMYSVCSHKSRAWVVQAMSIRKDYRRPFYSNFI